MSLPNVLWSGLMSTADASSYTIPFTSNSSLKTGFHLYAALGGGSPHLFEVDTGSVGVLVPRKVLGPSYQDFDPAQDIQFQYSSSGKVYSGQWVSLPVVLGVPVDWDGTGDYPTALVEVFAVDQPMQFDGGMLGIGFAIGGTADGGPLRNPLLRLNFQGTALSAGYIVRTTSIEVGLTSTNLAGFAFIGLERNAAGTDWAQPLGSLGLPGGILVKLPVLIDTGVGSMLLWLDVSDRPPSLAKYTQFPAGIAVSIAAPPADGGAEPALQYSFVTGEASQPIAPAQVEWRNGHGINTGRSVLAGFDYLYDAVGGRIGFRTLAANNDD